MVVVSANMAVLMRVCMRVLVTTAVTELTELTLVVLATCKLHVMIKEPQ